jgi:iron complex transport system substrate-binding protein
MRIVSLVPSATEILFALGLDDEIVGVTHECDHPPAAKEKPRLVKPLLDATLESNVIDTTVAELRGKGLPLYGIDRSLLRELRPDLIVTQGLCSVCTIPTGEVQEALRGLQGGHKVEDLNPMTLEDVLEDILRLGRATGREAEAHSLLEDLRARISRVDKLAGETANRPRVTSLEWLDPPFAAGHWNPGMVGIAGGIEVLGRNGKPSRRVSLDEAVASRPDVVLLMPCGFTIPRCLLELESLRERGWGGDMLLRGRRTFAVDGNAHFARPGPRLVDGLEILARVIHPEIFRAPEASAETYVEV